MQRIFAGEVYDMLPQPSGLVFSYCHGMVENKVAVFYKMLALDDGTVDDVTQAVYLISKFGSNYQAATEFCENYITAHSEILPSGKVFVCTDDGRAALIDPDDTVVWNGELKYRGHAPSDIAIHKNSLWACFQNAGVLIRFSLVTMREELRIGGKKTPFDRPYNIFIDGDCGVISNVGSKKLTRVNLLTYDVEDMHEFSESVYSYAKLKGEEYVLLESGIYKI